MSQVVLFQMNFAKQNAELPLHLSHYFCLAYNGLKMCKILLKNKKWEKIDGKM